jgi:L-fuculose-phosphate aldolase
MHRIKPEIIEEIIYIGKEMDRKGMVNAYEGNISYKDREEGLMYITPSGKRKIELVPDMIAVIDGEGHQIAGKFKPSSETPMHTRSYELRPDANACIHCHSPYLTAYALCRKPVVCNCYSEFIMLTGGDIPVVPYGKPGTLEIVEKLGPFIKRRNIVLLANHGSLCVGPDLKTAFNRLDSAERIAMILSYAKRVGEPQDLDDYEIARLLEDM